MLKTIAISVVVLIAALLLYATTRPSSFRVQRTITIQAPPQKIFALINDFHNWNTWSPWAKLDPAMQTTYGGPDAGQGATYEWVGNSKVGQGRMEILETTPPTDVTVKLDFLKPFEGHNTTVFTLTANPDSTTTVNWVMFGPSPYLSKLMGIFVSMDSLIGKDFDKGLANLKSVAER